ncbi:MAG: peptidoglycan-binding protein, partial [Geminicoccaceae bacterium]
MPDLPANEALPGLRPGENNSSLKAGPSADGGLPGAAAGADKGNSFNAVLAEGGDPSTGVLAKNAPAPSGLEGALRPDLLNRADTVLRSDAAARPNTAAVLDAAGLVGRSSEVLDTGKVDLPVLQLGSSDRAVGLLQRALGVLGFFTPLADNVFGAKTDQAVRSFQDGQGLARDGVVGNRETWPAINQALVTRHEGVSRLADALGSTQALVEPKAVELRQLNAVLAEFGERTVPPVTTRDAAATSADRSSSGDVSYTVRGGETLADISRTFGVPVTALIAANPELAKPYLILQGQLLIVPNPVKERTFRRPPRQLHPADPEGYLSSANMNADFAALVNGMIAQLRSEGHD